MTRTPTKLQLLEREIARLRPAAMRAGRAIEEALAGPETVEKRDKRRQAAYDADQDVAAYTRAVDRAEREWHRVYCG